MNVEVGSFIRPYAGQRHSGDMVCVGRGPGWTAVAVVDALGHGHRAAAMAAHLEPWLRDHLGLLPVEVIVGADKVMRGHGGCALAVLRIDEEPIARARFAAWGNCTGRRLHPRPMRMVSQDGVVGQGVRVPRETELKLKPGDIFVLCSDGVSEHFEVQQVPEVHGTLDVGARRIVELFGKRHDDDACALLRYGRRSSA